MLSKFSPLPWKYGKDVFTPSVNYRRIEGGFGAMTPTTRGFTLYGLISEDDARLICAAPRLFELLEKVYNECVLQGCSAELNNAIANIIIEVIGPASLPPGEVNKPISKKV